MRKPEDILVKPVKAIEAGRSSMGGSLIRDSSVPEQPESPMQAVPNNWGTMGR